MFLINSRGGVFRCGPYCYGQALFRRYGCFFAEFLGDLSLVRLGLLDLTTCVGLGTGSVYLTLEVFLGHVLLYIWIPEGTIFVTLGITLRSLPDLPNNIPHVSNVNPLIRIKYNLPSLHRNISKSWNINHVSIGFGFHHPLRPRLTLL